MFVVFFFFVIKVTLLVVMRELTYSLSLQATMFNDDTSDLNVLVASDAIGMGLNLNISRIIFSTMMKFDGFCNRELTVAEIKQIAGIEFSSYVLPPEVSFSPFCFPLIHKLLSIILGTSYMF